MLQPSIQTPLRRLAICPNALAQSLTHLRITPLQSRVSLPKTTLRHATHKSEGRANGAKNGPGKRLGAKKTGGQYVIPGNILYRQRGTLWFPGENVGLGKDHTLYATAPGYVTYYRDPAKHKKRQYIGVVLQRHQTLPVQAGVARRRRLGMYAQRMGGDGEADETTALTAMEAQVDGGVEGGDLDAAVKEIKRGLPDIRAGRDTPMRLGGPNRKQNWRVGLTIDAAAEKIRPYKSGDRFLAWRKRKATAKRAQERRGLKGARKGKK